MKDYSKIADKQISERFRSVRYIHLDEKMTVIAASSCEEILGRSAGEVLGAEAQASLERLAASGEKAVFDAEIDGKSCTVAAFRCEKVMDFDVIYRCYPVEKNADFAEAFSDACLLEAELSQRNLLDNLALPAVIGEKGRILYLNGAFMQMTGYSPSVLHAMKLSNLVSRADKEVVQKIESGDLSENTAELTINGAKGSLRTTLYAGGGQQVLGVFNDSDAEKSFEPVRTLLGEAFSIVEDAVCIFSGNNSLLYANTAFRQLFGEKADFFSAVCPDQDKNAWLDELKENHGVHYAAKLRRENGTELYAQVTVRAMSNGCCCAVIKDLTDSLDKEKLLDDFKTVDYPTGVTNSAHFRSRLTHEVENARKSGETLNLVMFSMINYSDIFFSSGSRTADILLKTTAQRAKGFLPENCSLGRLGESRFGIYFNGAKSEAIQFVQDFVSYMDSSTVDEGKTYYSKIYAGLCSYPDDSDSVQDLYSSAKNVLRNACASSSSPAYGCFGNDGVMETHRFKSSFEYSIEQAAENNDFYMEYQPITDLRTGEPAMLAALLRTKSSVLQNQVNMEFLMTAESTGAIVPIGYKTLEEIAIYQNERRQKGLRDMPVLFNLALCQLMDSGLIPFCTELFEKYELPLSSIRFQISSHQLRWHRRQCLSVISEMNRLGFFVSINRFNGRSVVLSDELSTNATVTYTLGSGISARAVAAAHAAGMKIIAVGAETEAQLIAVKSAGFDYCQGFVCGRPMKKEELDF